MFNFKATAVYELSNCDKLYVRDPMFGLYAEVFHVKAKADSDQSHRAQEIHERSSCDKPCVRDLMLGLFAQVFNFKAREHSHQCPRDLRAEQLRQVPTCAT